MSEKDEDKLEKRSLNDIQNDFHAQIGHAPHSIRQISAFCQQWNHQWKYSEINRWWPTRPDPQSKPEEKPINEGEYKAKMLEEQGYFGDEACLIKTCLSIKRLCLALNFFNNNTNKEDVLMEYFTKYVHLLNDYGHIVYDHLHGDHKKSNQSFQMIFDEINKEIQCDQIDKCVHHQAYCQNLTNKLPKNANLEYLYYVNLMNKVHSHLLHSHDCHIFMRINNEEEIQNAENVEIETAIRMDRNMNCIEKQIYNHAESLSVLNIERQNRYCSKIPATESSNESKSESKTAPFTFGAEHRFYYSEEYENNHDEDTGNIGYNYYEWYIRAHFSNLKSEIIDKLSITCYQYSLIKVKLLMDTEHMKAIKAAPAMGATHIDSIDSDMGCSCAECENEDKNKPIFSQEHLLSIILFSDYHHLSQQLRHSFIKTSTSEPDISLKERHSFYAHWARLLRESVELFGDKTTKTAICPSSYHIIDTLPFIDSFQMQLNGPLSSTSQLSVAMLFNRMNNKDDHGVVVNMKPNGSALPSCFNCAFVSYYGIENETIYFGGSGIKICDLKLFNNVRNAWESYEYCIKALDIYESIIAGDVSSTYAVTERDYNIISDLALFELQINNTNNRIYAAYIHELFHVYCQRKRTVIIDLSHTNHLHNFLKHLRCLNYSDLLLPFDEIATLYKNCENVCIKRKDKVIVVFDTFFDHLLKILDKINATKLSHITVFSVYIKCTEEILMQYRDALLDKKWAFVIHKRATAFNDLLVSRC